MPPEKCVATSSISSVVNFFMASGCTLGCVSKSQEMQFRADWAAFQGEKPQAYWLQVKVFQHRKAALDAENALRGFRNTPWCDYKTVPAEYPLF